mmetsp:Transcript_12709/g.19071  ORF Transcript_12709/g.19071 Transcript_12709/m.19071 type:complete len:161 (+) Transcript_12709:108-590(+)|eukprot:CAMPEP_0197315438 /NCGR_PEP_ID=MMETSP0891-20130614/38267_1 /TAXON_ID=44058 ORGANISM="Aureoumbra lagunensis, Strain CCMP1510" /NCGR_SAMPLE_ID=MMETSP0891 /ASSEMBLY_ACC=CAM_ASM_000534 /LENGTH=160 /DNA_ID=CAMNT_0042804393 /DNA_START=46 /DNA_END=528 /DNA_ORIENTATION=+
MPSHKLEIQRWEEEKSYSGRSRQSLISQILPVGTPIERKIDTDWFHGVVIDGYVEDDIIHYDIEYRDDGNRELAVPASEIELASSNTFELPEREGDLPQAQPPPLSPEIESIKCVSPIARVHGRSDDDELTTFVVNGSKTKLGAGGGLHGIRFLRESVNM